MTFGTGPALKRVVKKTIPIISKVCSALRLMPALSLAEKYIAFLQGKGSGIGWDIEAEVIAAEQFISRSGGIVLDIGANNGQWALALEARTGNGVRFILIEPDGSCFESLRKLPINQHIIQCAVSESEGEVTLFEYGRKSNLSSLHKRRDSLAEREAFKEVTVKARTIDSIIREFEIERVDYIKMDLEGHDLFAMRGAAESIAAGKVKALAFEFGLSNVNSGIFFKDIWDFLQSFHCHLHRILPGGNLLKIDKYTEDLEHFAGATNYLAAF